MSKFEEIIDGWRNHIFPSKKKAGMIKRVSNERLLICHSCPFHSKNTPIHLRLRPDAYCTDCGCTLIAKTKSLKSSCPQGKWTSLNTEFSDNVHKKTKFKPTKDE